MRNSYTNKGFLIIKKFTRAFIAFLFFCCQSFSSSAQCPPNIDFELGDFTGWQCWVGWASVVNFKNVITWSPNMPVDPALYPTRFQMLSSNPGDGNDPYGGFPKNCPNGSGRSIKLGNNQPGAQAEGVSYTFTIPPGQNQFNLIYHYAVVFQGPQHENYEQPRMVIDIYNLTDNIKIDCSSFEFLYKKNEPNLPGFFLSPNPGGPTPVWCKNWSATTIKLDGQAGKTIQLFFKTADCTPTGHFGYAYIDVNTECSSSFIGATFCPDDAFINVTAPFGYETYKWWNINDPTTILGTTQTINFTPPPPAGTTLKVAITPYAGYGCVDTLTAELLDTLTVIANAGPDRLSCQNAPVQLGINPRPGFVYSWSPVAGLSNPAISNPIASPSSTTQYVLTVTNAGGGCLTRDTVMVRAAVLDDSLEIIGPTAGCIDMNSPTILKVLPADSVQWYRNGVAIPGATQTQYNVVQGGSYYATIFNFTGCSLNTAIVVITAYAAPDANFTTNAADQCFNEQQFIFTNTSAIAAGTMQYYWDLGDGTTSTNTDVTHQYAAPGTYTVKLLVTSDNGCLDSINYIVNVFESPVGGFTVNENELCFNNNQFVFTDTSSISSGTLQYRWDMGDGNIFTTRNVSHNYTVPGTYTIMQVVTSVKGCTDTSRYYVTVNASPVAAFTIANPQQCFGNNLFNFVNNSTIYSGNMQFAWDLGDGNTASTPDVTHSYAQPGDYLVKLVATSDKGCVDSTSFAVKVFTYATPDFYVEPVCVNLRLPLTNRTINNTGTPLNFLWDFGNGQTSNQVNPVYSYPAAGTYTLKLSVNSNFCPQTVTSKQVVITIDAPATGIRYPDKNAITNFPEQLQARNLGSSVIWNPGLYLDNRYSFTPHFRGVNAQLYTIELKTMRGCVTIDTQLVKTRKKIEIYVPTVFTPGNGDGKNDLLRPLLMGFEKVNYFRVYNRWGKLLFQMQSDRPGWDGRTNGQIAELQTVVWMIEAVDIDGQVHRRQGTTVLVR